MSYIEMEQEISCQQMQIEDLTRQLAQANAVIAEQKNHIKGHLEIQQIQLEHIDEQSALIEKLADVLKCVDGGHTEHGWLGEMGKIEMWRVDEAISDYNQWKEQKC